MPAARGVRGHACLLTSTAPYKDGWSEAIPIATRTGVDGYRFSPSILRDCMMRTECRIFCGAAKPSGWTLLTGNGNSVRFSVLVRLAYKLRSHCVLREKYAGGNMR